MKDSTIWGIKMTKWNKAIGALIGAAALCVSLGLATPAAAATDAISPVPSQITSILTITDASGKVTTTTEVASLKSVTDMTTGATTYGPAAAYAPAPASAARAGSPQGAQLLCNKFYSFADSNNTYTVQHACGSSTAPWGIKLQPALCASITSLVTESGQSWALNGRTMPNLAPHVEPCSYQFHGTYNPTRDGDHVSYVDLYTFKVAGNGDGRLQVYGSFTATGVRCGSATSC